jgi:hypothetical protein
VNLQANPELQARLIDMQRGLHRVMDELINRNDKAAAEVILRQLDEHLALTIRQTKPV